MRRLMRMSEQRPLIIFVPPEILLNVPLTGMRIHGSQNSLAAKLVFVAIGFCISSGAEVKDRRIAIAQESAAYRAQHPDAMQLFERERTGRGGHLHKKQHPTEVPGGVGYGYFYWYYTLLWSNSTILDYYIITPDHAGGNLETWQYLTSTCRSPLGTESLISYFSQEGATFMVYDWARTDPWQTSIQLPGHNTQYLSMRPDEFANMRQMCHIRNGTFYQGFSSGMHRWRNQVLLFDFNRGDWDLVYSYNYATTNRSGALYSTNSGAGYWGPIVETFQTNFANLNPMGFDLIRLFQDSNPTPFWLDTTNTYVINDYPFQLISEAPYTGFVIEGPGNPPDTFPISSVSNNPSAHQLSVNVNTQFGHAYRFYTNATLPGQWKQYGPMTNGNGTNISVKISTVPPATFVKADAIYNTGSLCVTANTSAASFTLTPASGLISPQWVSTPDSNHWDKTVVGLAPGQYTLNFGPVSGHTTPSPKMITIITNTVVTAIVTY